MTRNPIDSEFHARRRPHELASGPMSRRERFARADDTERRRLVAGWLARLPDDLRQEELRDKEECRRTGQQPAWLNRARGLPGAIDGEGAPSLQPDWPDADQAEIWGGDELRGHRRVLFAILLCTMVAGLLVACLAPARQDATAIAAAVMIDGGAR